MNTIKRFFVRLVTLALTMYLLPLSDYVASWFGGIASVAHAASCTVSQVCGSKGAKGTTATTIEQGKIITCIVGNEQFQDRMCTGSEALLITPVYTGDPVTEGNGTWIKIVEQEDDFYLLCK